MTLSLSLTVNGQDRVVELEDPRPTLLDVLRERLALPGTKKGCDRGQCGACTILVDGQRINSCLALAISYDGAAITTIEGLAENGTLHPVQQAFIDHDGFQCGFCTPGQIMSAVGLIAEAQAMGDSERVRVAPTSARKGETQAEALYRHGVNCMDVIERPRVEVMRSCSSPISSANVGW